MSFPDVERSLVQCFRNFMANVFFILKCMLFKTNLTCAWNARKLKPWEGEFHFSCRDPYILRARHSWPIGNVSSEFGRLNRLSTLKAAIFSTKIQQKTFDKRLIFRWFSRNSSNCYWFTAKKSLRELCAKKDPCPKKKGPVYNDEALETFLHGETLQKVKMRPFCTSYLDEY